MAIHQSLSAEFLPLPPHLEVIAVKLTGPVSLVICVVYFPPNSSYANCSALCNYLSALLDGNTVVTIFNFPKINWHTLTGDSETSALFCEFVFDNDLDHLVTEPTHRQGNTLDLMLTNCSNIVHDVQVHTKSCIPTDPFIISSSIQTPVLPTRRSKSRFIYNFRKADLNQMADFLLDCNFEPCLSSLDLEFVWSFIKSTIYQAMDLLIPKVRLRANNSPKWLIATIRHKLNCTHHLRKQAKRHPSVTNQRKLDHSELELQDAMKVMKSEYESNLIQEFAFSKNYKIYEYIKGLRKEDSLPPTMSDGTTTATEDHEKVTLFNKYFFSVFTSSSYCLPSMEDSTTPGAAITNIDMSDTEVYQALAALDPSKSSGIDGIGPNVLKHGALALNTPSIQTQFDTLLNDLMNGRYIKLLLFSKLVTELASRITGQSHSYLHF